MQTTMVQRFSRIARTTHWLFASSGLLLLVSGFVHLPPLHSAGAALFIGTILFHSVYQLRRREFSLLPRRGDVWASVQTLVAMLRRTKEPPHDKFLAEQRLAHAAIAGTGLLLVVTGVMLVYQHATGLPTAPVFRVALVIHRIAVGGFAALVLVHILALLLKVNRPLLRSMFTGTVPQAYADARHPRWDYPGKSGTADQRP